MAKFNLSAFGAELKAQSQEVNRPAGAKSTTVVVPTPDEVEAAEAIFTLNRLSFEKGKTPAQIDTMLEKFSLSLAGLNAALKANHSATIVGRDRDANGNPTFYRLEKAKVRKAKSQ